MNIKIYNGKDVPLKTFKQLNDIDNNAFGYEYHYNLLKSLFWVLMNREGYIIALDDNGTIVGYLSIISVKKKYFDLLKSGTIIDIDLPLKSFIKISKKGPHYLYFSSIVVKEEYKGTMLFIKLFSQLKDTLYECAKKGAYVKEIVMDALTDEGCNLSRILNAKFIGKSKHNSSIYLSNLEDPNFKFPFKEWNAVLDLYKKN